MNSASHISLLCANALWYLQRHDNQEHELTPKIDGILIGTQTFGAAVGAHLQTTCDPIRKPEGQGEGVKVWQYRSGSESANGRRRQ